MSEIIGTRTVSDGETPRQMFEQIIANSTQTMFGFGERLAIVNVDFQDAHTRIDRYRTADETDPRAAQ